MPLIFVRVLSAFYRADQLLLRRLWGLGTRNHLHPSPRLNPENPEKHPRHRHPGVGGEQFPGGGARLQALFNHHCWLCCGSSFLPWVHKIRPYPKTCSLQVSQELNGYACVAKSVDLIKILTALVSWMNLGAPVHVEITINRWNTILTRVCQSLNFWIVGFKAWGENDLVIRVHGIIGEKS